MSRNSQVDYTQYIHEFVDDDGKTRFAVGQWSQENGQFTTPLDARTRKLTGCSAEFSRTAKGLGGYLKRSDALRRARYLFSETPEEIELGKTLNILNGFHNE
jgi:hypothetical protein